MTDVETCEVRGWKCCDAYSEADYAEEQGHDLPLTDAEHNDWYIEHVARYRGTSLFGTDAIEARARSEYERDRRHSGPRGYAVWEQAHPTVMDAYRDRARQESP